VPVIFFLLFKRRRWGWILLFADNLFSFITGIIGSYFFFKFQSIHHTSIISFLLPILIKGAFLFFLWQNSIADFFGVNYETKKKTFAIVTIGTLLFIFCLQIFLK
jgi:zinc transporter ZupT